MKIDARLDARREILAAANKGRRRVAPYTMRHLQRCVCIVRRRNLVHGDVLAAAGFNREERR